MDLLESEMNEKNISDADVAKAIKVDLSTWYRRKLAPHQIKIGELEIIKSLLNLSNEKAISIFLA